MRICLISKDERTDRLCRAAFSGLEGVEYSCVAEPADAGAADLYVRDSALSEAPRIQAGSTQGGREDRDALMQYLLLASCRVQQHTANFITRALDDLSVPVTILDGYCGLLAEESMGPLNDIQVEIICRMQRSVRRLGGILRGILRLTSIGSDWPCPTLEPGDIFEVVRQALSEALPIASAAGVEILDAVDEPANQLLFDAREIEQVLVALLENACRFAPRNTVVEVRGRSVHASAPQTGLRGGDGSWYRLIPDSADCNAYRIDVTDEGPAVPSDRIHTIFDPSLSCGGRTDRSGAGLGLATCRIIAAAHAGNIFVESGSRGATFSVVLPFIERSHEGAGAQPGFARREASRASRRLA